jgi:Bacterial tandem repeat domain 1
MTISRRQALGWASAFAATAGTTELSFAGAAARAAKALGGRNGRSVEPAQLFQQLLIHRDEAHHTPHVGVIAIASPDAAWYAVDTLDNTQFRMFTSRGKKRGYRLRRISAFKTHEGVRYAAAWEQLAGPDWHANHDMSRQDFDALNTKRLGHGFRITHLDARLQYAGIWEIGDGSTQQVFSGLSIDAYQQQAATLAGQGLRPTRLSLGVDGSTTFVAAIFDKDPGAPWQANALMTSAEFHKTNMTLKAQGYRLRDASGHMLSRKPMFSGVWDQA